MGRDTVATSNAPAALGPYSQAVKAEDFVFTAGQVGLDPTIGRLVEGGIEAETRQTLENISAILEAAGSSLSQVVKTTVYLQNFSDFPAMNKVYGEFFADDPPARAGAGVAALPLGALVEIDAVAVLGTG